MKEMNRYDASVDREMLDRYQTADIEAEQRQYWIDNRSDALYRALEDGLNDLPWYKDAPQTIPVREDLAAWVIGEERDDLVTMLQGVGFRQVVWVEYCAVRAKDELERGDWR